MNRPEHPHADVLADHHARLLAGAEQAAVQRHLAGCPGCQRVVAELDEVSRLLAAEGHRPVTMPASVAARLDGALAEESAQRSDRGAVEGGEHRSVAVTSLASRRTSGEPFGRRRVWPALAAAAAVVVVSAVGFQVMQGQGQGADSAASGGGAQDSVQEGGAAAAPESDDSSPESGVPSTPTDALKAAPEFRSTSRSSVAELTALARALARGNTEMAVRARGVCATPLDDSGNFASAAVPVSLIRWQGRPAILQVDVAGHRLVVLDCETARQRLFSTTY